MSPAVFLYQKTNFCIRQASYQSIEFAFHKVPPLPVLKDEFSISFYVLTKTYIAFARWRIILRLPRHLDHRDRFYSLNCHLMYFNLPWRFNNHISIWGFCYTFLFTLINKIIIFCDLLILYLLLLHVCYTCTFTSVAEIKRDHNTLSRLDDVKTTQMTPAQAILKSIQEFKILCSS